MPGILDILAGPVKGLVSGVGGIIDDLHTSEEEKLEAKSKILAMASSFQTDLVKAQRDIVVSEAQGKSWLQRNWRPMTALTFLVIIANNYIVVPYVLAFGARVPTLDIPPGMWALLNIMIGGYVAGRSVEKVAETLATRK